jgi:hypothetical protein
MSTTTEHRRRSLYGHQRSKESRAERAPRPATEMEKLNARHADQTAALREQQDHARAAFHRDINKDIAHERLHHNRDLDQAVLDKRVADQRKKNEREWDALKRRQDAEREAVASRDRLA